MQIWTIVITTNSLTRNLIDALIQGNSSLVNQYYYQLFELADKRAKSINSINPFWDETDVRNLLYTFLQYTIEHATTLLTGEHVRNIDIFDRLQHHADRMGDYFVEGFYNYLAYRGQNFGNIDQQINQ